MDIKGKYMMEKMENTDTMMKIMGVSQDVMKKIMGSTGTMMEVMKDGDKMTMKRSDGMTITFTMGKEFDIQLDNMMVKAMPKMEGDMLMMKMTMPGGKMVQRKYKFSPSGLVMEMMAQNSVMKIFYKRMPM